MANCEFQLKINPLYIGTRFPDIGCSFLAKVIGLELQNHALKGNLAVLRYLVGSLLTFDNSVIMPVLLQQSNNFP